MIQDALRCLRWALPVAVVLTGMIRAAAAAPFALGSDHRSAGVIVVLDPGGELAVSDAFAPVVEDLSQVLERVTGCAYAVRFVPSLAEGPQEGAIRLMLTADAPELAGEKPLNPAEYQIATDAAKLDIIGFDAVALGHGVYGLLHELGCRWYYPGELWAVLPTDSGLTVDLNRREKPDFDLRRRLWVGHGRHSAAIRTDLDAWMRRNRMLTSIDIQISHSWPGIDPETDFEAHPEWFSLTRNKAGELERSKRKPCYSHPEVIRRGIERALSYFRENPGADMITCSPPDGLGFCQCELCLKAAGVTEVTDRHGTQFGVTPGGTLVCIPSETVFRYANEVARAIAQAFPPEAGSTGKYVGMLAYSGYAHPPSFALEPNMYVEITQGYRRTPLRFHEQAKAYAEIAAHLGIYEYYDVMQWSWDRPGAARAADLDYVQGTMRYYHDLGMRSLSGEISNNFGPNGIGYYALARLLWDADQDVRAIEAAFYADAFGPAAEAVRRFYQRWESGQRLSPMTVAMSYTDLSEAARLVKDDPQRRDRVDHLRLYARFLHLYLKPEQSASRSAAAVERWTASWGADETARRIGELAALVRSMMDTHMVHSWAFNRYLAHSGKAAGLDTSQWQKAGPIPTDAEIQAQFARDMAAMPMDEVRDVAVEIYSRDLVRLPDAVVAAADAADPGEKAIHLEGFRSGTLLHRLDGGEKLAIAFGEPNRSSALWTDERTYLDGQGMLAGRAIGGTALEAPDAPDAPGAPGAPDAAQLVFQAEEPGFVEVKLEAAPTAIQGPAVFAGDALQMKTASLYFWVPRGTDRFMLYTNGAGEAGPSFALRVAEEVVLEAAESPLSAFVVEVPQGMDGRIWCFTGPGNANSLGKVSVAGIPDYFALRPEQLLVPRETVMRDGR